MNVAITGASGFVSRQLALAHLARGDRVRALSRGPASMLPVGVELASGDLLGAIPANFLGGADVLYHCAGEIRDPAAMENVNVEGTRRLLQAAQGRIGRWVQLSSIGVHGPVRSGMVDERTECRPQGPYETSKRDGEALIPPAASTGGFSYSILRPSIVFGAGMPNQSLYQLIRAVRARLFFFVGAPGASANYVHIAGVVDALMRCGSASAAAGRTYNLSDHTSIEEFVAAIAAELGIAAPRLRLPEALARGAALFSFLPRFPLTRSRVDALTTRVVYSIERIRAELGYAHPMTIRQGLTELVAEWKARQ